MRRVYLDHNATTPVHPEVLEAFSIFCRDMFGNPSSIHWAGRAVKGELERARESVADLVGCHPAEVVFTSSGTEADNMAIKGVAAACRNGGGHIITARTEHPAVVSTCLALEQEGYRVTWLPVDHAGRPDLGALDSAVAADTILISLMYANNETGTILPVREIGEIAARRGIVFHCDAVQAVGRVPVDCREEKIGLLSLSGHKFNAPKGVGALVVRRGVRLSPLIHGGQQERSRRGGTENVPGIMALGTACRIAAESMAEEAVRLARLRDDLENGILNSIADVRVNGDSRRRLPNTTSLSFGDAEGDSLLFNLDLAGIAASAGSACSSGTLKGSPVLEAMGVPASYARGTVRFSLGRETTAEDVAYVVEAMPGIVGRIRRKR